MEKNFYEDNFEQFLKDSTENFRMYPSKRVWHSIYNDLHPSRKWPSLAICLLFICSVIYVGVANKDQTHINIQGNNQAFSNETVLPGTSNKVGASSNRPSTTIAFAEPVKSTADATTTNNILHNFGNESTTIDTRLNPLNNAVTDQTIQAANILAFYKNSLNVQQGSLGTDVFEGTSNNKKQQLNIVNENIITESADSKVAKDEKTIKDIAKTKAELKNADKEWIEDFAFHNKPFTSKWKSKVTYELYATPSIGYRTMKHNTVFNPFVSSSFVSASPAGNPDYEDAVSQAAAVNMELGGSILYSITNRFNLKIGVQLNYTNYNINAYELKHPTMTTLMLTDINSGLPLLSPRSTTLTNSEGVYSKKLNNNTYQISLPVGADFKLLGNETIKWFAGATIQPTYITGGNAYFISSDLKNYVTDDNLMRKWNLNAGIETFISYKTKSGIILNAGPQFRYQLLSTYSKQYTYDEKLYNVGLKIGVITKF